MNAAMADQLDAATAQVQHGMDRLVMDAGYSPSTTRPDPWLLALLVDAVSDTCEHLVDMQAPQPVFISAHRRRTECGPCHRQTTTAMQGTAEDAVCDRCRLTPADGLLTTMAAAFGPIFVPMGLCDQCVPAIHGDHR